MSESMLALKERADKARILYKKKLITRSEALKEIQPYIDAYNEKSQTIAKKYKMRPKLINSASYLR